MPKKSYIFSLCVAMGLVLSSAHAQTPSTPPGTWVRLDTQAGPIDLQLFDTSAPRTTANFLSYVRSGAYQGSFFHRLVRGFVLQGGGLTWNASAQPPLGTVTVSAPVANEFSSSRSNLRGTVAMAKVDGNPDSATSQWFINLADNAANLDNQNGGFTVFGRVLAPSMALVDALGTGSLINASGCANFGAVASAMAQVPMFSAPANCEAVNASHLVQIQSVQELPARHAVADSERVFDHLEAVHPKWFAPASPATQQGNGFVFRYYSRTQNYIGVMNGRLYGLGPATAQQLKDFGPLSQWLQQASSQGY